MKLLKHSLLIIALTTLAFTTAHKYYVSITKIEYVKEKQSIQIISKIFINDLEMLLRKRYDPSITLNEKSDENKIDTYIEKYLLEKLKISINKKAETLLFIGKKYEDDVVHCYLEIENISEVKSFEVQNKVLYDAFEDQKNIVRTYINNQHKTFVLIPENEKGVLNF